MAVFPGQQDGPTLNAGIQAVREVLIANPYIAKEINRQVGERAPQNINEWKKARAEIIHQALKDNKAFSDAVKAKAAAQNILDPAL